MTPDSAHASGRRGDAAPPTPRVSDAAVTSVAIGAGLPARDGENRVLVGVIWDLDGTLADTEEAHFRAWQALFARLERTLSWEEFKPTFGLGNPDILRLLIDANLADDDVQRLSDEKEALFRQFSEDIKPMPGAIELARHLHRLGIPQAIGSSAPPENIPHVLNTLAVSDLFEATVSRWEVEQGKPAPDIFLVAARKIGVPPVQCLVLEDAPPGIAAARAGGMRCVALVGTWPADTLTNADYMVRTFADLVWDRETYARFASGNWNPPDDVPTQS